MSKSELITLVAQLPDGDPRLEAVATAVTGGAKQDAASLKTFPLGKAAREIGVSRSTLWRAIRDGKLATIKIRRAHRISETELLRFVEGK